MKTKLAAIDNPSSLNRAASSKPSISSLSITKPRRIAIAFICGLGLPLATAWIAGGAEGDASLSESNRLALALHDQGKYAEAIPFFEHALQLRPAYADAHVNLGIALVALRPPWHPAPS